MGINKLNQQLAKLKEGVVTELSESEPLPMMSYRTYGARPILEIYLIRDLVPIIEQYLEWRNLNHVPLFSVPRHKFQHMRHIILFGRADKGEFTLCRKKDVKVHGHFPLLLSRVDRKVEVRTDDNDTSTKYLIGYVCDTNLYPKFDDVVFTWHEGIKQRASMNRLDRDKYSHFWIQDRRFWHCDAVPE
jgi:hypothetical protein